MYLKLNEMKKNKNYQNVIPVIESSYDVLFGQKIYISGINIISENEKNIIDRKEKRYRKK